MNNFVIILRFTLRKTILAKKEWITKFLFLKGTLCPLKKSVLLYQVSISERNTTITKKKCITNYQVSVSERDPISTQF